MAPKQKEETAAAKMLSEAANRDKEAKDAKIAEQLHLLQQARAAADRDRPTSPATAREPERNPTPAESTPSRKPKGGASPSP
eukprot:1710682-Heterocapsa_arctica.AAC.1